MDYDYTGRGYLLPEGCKDLNEVYTPKVFAKDGLFIIKVFLPEARREEVEVTTEARKARVWRKASKEYAAVESFTEVPPDYDLSHAWVDCHCGVLRIRIPRYGDTWTAFDKELARRIG